MKNIFAIILLAFTIVTFKVQGQTTGGKYHSQPDLSRFEGKWVYSDGNISFSIELRKEKVAIKHGNDDFSIDLIQGDYTFVKDGKIVDASDKSHPAITSGGYEDAQKSKKVIRVLFSDLGKQSKRCQAYLELIDGSPNKLKWTLTNIEHIVVGKGSFDPGFSVPEKLVLTKAK